MLERLVKSGFGFLKSAGDDMAIYENKFTGLWLLVNFSENSYQVMES